MAFRLMKVFGWILFLSIVASAESAISQSQKSDSDSRKVVVNLTPAERAWLSKHPIVRWGEDPDWPPFSQYDSHHNLVGIDPDVVRLAVTRAGLNVTPVHANSWSEILAKARAGQVDFLSATA